MRIRPRRLRKTALLRESIAETRVEGRQLIQPHFVHEDAGTEPIDSMPGIARMGLAPLIEPEKGR